MIISNIAIKKNRFNKNKFFITALRGQSVIEYAVLIAIVVAALVAMRIYMTRGVEGYLRGSVDEEQQFIPGSTTYKYTTTQVSPIVSTETFQNGVYKYTLNNASQINRSTTAPEQYGNLLNTGNLFTD